MRRPRPLIIVLGIILAAILLLANFMQQKYAVPILMYHSVLPEINPQDRLLVSCEAFQRQMRFLKSRHYNVVPLEHIAALIKDKKKIPPRTIAITFDDGYQNNYTYAFPILKKYNLAATIFVIVNEVGRVQGDRLSWDEIIKMQDSGVITFGSHALGPDPLTKIKPERELRKQIFDSKSMLEARLGRKVSAFSYPEGRFNDQIRQLVIDAGYKLAVATNPGKKFSNRDIFALKRLRISSKSDNLFIFWIQAGGYYNFMRERRRK